MQEAAGAARSKEVGCQGPRRPNLAPRSAGLLRPSRVRASHVFTR